MMKRLRWTAKRGHCRGFVGWSAALLGVAGALSLAQPAMAHAHHHGGPHGHPGGFHGHPGGFRGHPGGWHGGHWHHGWHGGRLGWWWIAPGLGWTFYNAPIYPYPEPPAPYVAPPAAPAMWYYCDNPPGYYPYVPRCTMPWRPVPAQ